MRNALGILVFSFFFAILFVPGLHAGPVTYTYTGFEFDARGITNNVTDLYQFQTADSVTATVTLSSLIPSNTYADYINDPTYTGDVESWSMMSGGLTLSSSDSGATLHQLIFDTTGSSLQWEMYAGGLPSTPPSDMALSSLITINGGVDGATYDEAFILSNASGFNNATLNNDPGAWTLQQGQSPDVPEPGSLLLLGSGLLIISRVLRLRRKLTR